MTTEAKPRIKITYATLRNDNEELHAQYEEGVRRLGRGSARTTGTSSTGAGCDGSAGTFEARSPIDRDLLDRDVREG